MAIILEMQGHIVAWRQATFIREKGGQPFVDAAEGDIALFQARFTRIGTQVDQGIL
ncbi:hypothetical protein D3C78_1740370 [compost metagenome]